MSLDFTVVFSGPLRETPESLALVVSALGRYGLVAPGPVYRVDLQSNDGPLDEMCSMPIGARAYQKLSRWPGASIQFVGPKFNFSVVVYRWSEGFTNYHVDVDTRTLERTARVGAMNELYACLVGLAVDVNAKGGVGAFEIEPDPIPPAKIIPTIWNDPSNPGHPSHLGLVSKQEMTRRQVEEKARGSFVVSEDASYYLLEGLDFRRWLSDSAGGL